MKQQYLQRHPISQALIQRSPTPRAAQSTTTSRTGQSAEAAFHEGPFRGLSGSPLRCPAIRGGQDDCPIKLATQTRAPCTQAESRWRGWQDQARGWVRRVDTALVDQWQRAAVSFDGRVTCMSGPHGISRQPTSGQTSEALADLRRSTESVLANRERLLFGPTQTSFHTVSHQLAF